MQKRLTCASGLVVLVLSLASGANALTSDKRTYFTFSQPVALPGVTLPPGTYMFRVANHLTSANIVQVASRQGDRSYALIATLPTVRDDAREEPALQFMETPTGAPLAVKAWWATGQSVGYEFIYEKDQRDAVRQSVLEQPPAATAVTPGAASEVGPSRSLEELEGSPDVIEGPGVPPRADAATQNAQAPASSQAQRPVQEAQEPAPSAGQAREELPRTASPIPMVLLSGLVTSLVGLRLLRRS